MMLWVWDPRDTIDLDIDVEGNMTVDIKMYNKSDDELDFYRKHLIATGVKITGEEDIYDANFRR